MKSKKTSKIHVKSLTRFTIVVWSKFAKNKSKCT